MSETLLQVSDIATAYGNIEALKGVNLSAADGEITCLLGPNGAGKTTLLMTIAGILRPRRGSITLRGNEIAGRAPAASSKRESPSFPRTGWCFRT